MIRNYLKVAWRSLLRNKSQSFINIAGLAVGLASGLLILLWVQNEYSVDSFFQTGGRLFKVYKTNFDHHVPSGSYETPGVLADELKRTFPDIEYATNIGFGENSAFQVGDKVVKMNGNSAGADFFKMFSYPLLAGSAQTALNSPDAIAISRHMAEIFYGSPNNAIGKTIRYQNQKYFKITAVFENLPKNASQSFDFLTNWDAFLNNNPWARDMGNTGPQAYVMLKPQANVAAVNAKIAHVFDLYYHINRSTANWHADIALQPYAEAYLHNNIESGKPSGGRIEYVHLFSIIAVFILLIACINFMNLSTARSVKRAKEVGVRKVAGAQRASLIWQFITESILVTLLAVVIALVLVLLLLPEFNQITQKQIGLPFAQPGFWMTIIGITLVTGLVAGSYPALFLSSFKPVKVLKSAVKLDTGTLFFRKGLV
ncbi:MAG TPA: ABC transporter permease, partial [Mucilaginibacter sp.]|nr:ABC transporter permease [Mucilaginibacter sp.]